MDDQDSSKQLLIEQQRETPARQSAPEESRPEEAMEDAILASLQRIEGLLGGMRGVLNSLAGEVRHREYSPARLVASILQALVLGLVLWALSDWVFGEDNSQLLIKLAFAAVLQLTALTGFVLGRGVD
ncbi:MAG: hypothetical protein ABIG44_16295 [Planctomycetota bacterium]